MFLWSTCTGNWKLFMERSVMASLLVGVGLHVFVMESLNRSSWTWMKKTGMEAPELQVMPLNWNTSTAFPGMELHLLQSDNTQQCTSTRKTAENWCLRCTFLAHAPYCWDLSYQIFISYQNWWNIPEDVTTCGTLKSGWWFKLWFCHHDAQFSHNRLTWMLVKVCRLKRWLGGEINV